LTRTIVYPSFGHGIKIISNFSPELQPILGDFIQKFGSFKAPKLLVIANWRIGFLPEIRVS
jgi:hypothetical protein